MGSSNYITNLAGDVTQHIEYLPFGELLVDEHLNSYNTPFKFNAKEFDAESGNYYYGARYYDPKFSVWLSVDPLVEKTFDAYGYCYLNPIRYIDPTGMEGEDPERRIESAREHKDTPYKQQTDHELRTGSSEAALEYMDCSELIARVLYADDWTDEVKNMPTSNLTLQNWLDDNWEKVESPIAGDIVVWTGHTALVTEDYEEGGKVSVIHATKYANVSGVVEEKYSMDYYNKKGASFYRPTQETSATPTIMLDEVTITARSNYRRLEPQPAITPTIQFKMPQIK